ncbi:MAG: hypothetical protein KDD78_05680 [Caldilineaceae bacterium]|nr:hypothetical protein [Caldilineaceae bacterium]
MNWNKLIRQTHRWFSIVFTLAVLINIVLNVVSMAPEEFVLWAGILTLLPLALLLFTGLYLFVLPYTAKRRSRPRID